MGNYLPLSASTYSGDIDSLFWLVTILMGISLVVTELTLFYFLIRFRKKDGVRAKYITGDTKKGLIFVLIPLAVFVAFDATVDIATANVWKTIKQTDPTPNEEVMVVGHQWYWDFTHAGPDGILKTADDITTSNEMHVKVNSTVRFYLQSTDVLHSFSVPVFRLKQDVVPGREIRGWFEATQTGEFDIQCTEMCGIGHGDMAARIFIHTPEEYDAWVKENAPEVSEEEQMSEQTEKEQS